MLSDSKSSADSTRAAESTVSRVARLAHWMSPASDARDGDVKVTVEIADMSLREVWRAVDQLATAPNTEDVARLRGKLLLRWITLDPFSALQYWKDTAKSLRWTSGLAYEVFPRWARFDPHGALDGWRAFTEVHRDHTTDFALTEILSAMAKTDFDSALYQAMLFEGDQRSHALRGIATLAGNEDRRQEVLQALLALDPGPDRIRALSEAMNSWSRHGQRDAAVAWLDANEFTDQERNRIDIDIARSWFHEERREAADWLVARAENPVQRSHALENMADMWSQYDPITGAYWLIEQGLDEDAGPAMRLFSKSLAKNFPEPALRWAEAIPNAALRQEAMDRVTRVIQERHPGFDAVQSSGSSSPVPSR